MGENSQPNPESDVIFRKVSAQPPCLWLGRASEDDCRTSALPRCARLYPCAVLVRIPYPVGLRGMYPLAVHRWTTPLPPCKYTLQTLRSLCVINASNIALIHKPPKSLINHQPPPPTFLINLTSSPHQHYTLFLIKIQPPIMNIPHQPPPLPTFLINLTSSPLSTINLFSETTSTKHYPSAINHNCKHFASTNNHQLSTYLINQPEPPTATFFPIHRKPYQSYWPPPAT